MKFGSKRAKPTGLNACELCLCTRLFHFLFPGGPNKDNHHHDRRKDGSAGTHNGMRSILGCLGNQQGFPRIRVGVGAKPEGWDLADWVLSTFSAQEEKALGPAIDRAADAALCIMEKGIAEASNRYSGKA